MSSRKISQENYSLVYMKKVGKRLKIDTGNVCNSRRTAVSSQSQLQDETLPVTCCCCGCGGWKPDRDRILGSFSKRWKGKLRKGLEGHFCRCKMVFTEDPGCVFTLMEGGSTSNRSKLLFQLSDPPWASLRSCCLFGSRSACQASLNHCSGLS